MPTWKIVEGDCATVRLPQSTVDAIVTSPPYARQRVKEYGGVHERDYPQWLVERLDALRPALKPSGSAAIVIRPHIRAGRLSDYVLRTRLELHAAGWVELDEWIWDKVSGPPFGHIGRPRRSWEHILWFGTGDRPWCDPLANGRDSTQIGVGRTGIFARGYGGHSTTGRIRAGRSRGVDIARIAVGRNAKDPRFAHAAQYPVPLAAWIIRYLCPPGGTVLDPFCGSGTTGVAALAESRDFIGIDIKPDYVAMARTRLTEAFGPTT